MLVQHLQLVSTYDVVTYAVASFLQMFLWERFETLSPKPIEFKATKPDKVIVYGEDVEETL